MLSGLLGYAVAALLLLVRAYQTFGREDRRGHQPRG
jgi:hypothetical protein